MDEKCEFLETKSERFPCACRRRGNKVERYLPDIVIISQCRQYVGRIIRQILYIFFFLPAFSFRWYLNFILLFGVLYFNGIEQKKKHSVSKCLKGDFGWFLLSLMMMKMMMILWDTGVKGSFSERDFAVCRFEIK